MSTRNLPVGKGRTAGKADSLTAVCEPIIYKMYEHRYLTTLWSSTACHRDSFLILYLLYAWCVQVVPWGFRKEFTWIKKAYNNPPVFVTENGVSDLGGLNDTGRIYFYTVRIYRVFQNSYIMLLVYNVHMKIKWYNITYTSTTVLFQIPYFLQLLSFSGNCVIVLHCHFKLTYLITPSINHEHAMEMKAQRNETTGYKKILTYKYANTWILIFNKFKY
jgi:hypothetical protein